MIEIRVATHEDVDALVALLGALFAQEAEFEPNPELQVAGLSAIISDAAIGEILVAVDDGNVIGMVNLLYTISTALGGRVAVLEDMVVDASYRGRGIGSTLLSAAIAFCRERGCKRITLLTDLENEAAHSFYEKMAFTRSEMVPYRFVLE